MAIPKSNLKKKTVTTITKVVKEEWILIKDLYYTRISTYKLPVKGNGAGELINITNSLSYRGKDIKGYNITPIYKGNVEMLKKWNPYWGEKKDENLNKDYKWFETTELPEPEEIDVQKDIIYAQSATHSFYDINLEPLPVVIMGDYIEACLNNANYDLPKLKKYLDKHKNVVHCSEILSIPYYNSGNGCGDAYIEIIVYPKVEWLKKLQEDNNSYRAIFTSTWDKKHPDFLKTRQFMIEKKENIYEDED